MGFFLCSNKLFKGDFNMNLVTVRDIYKNRENYLNKEIEVGGWVRSIRDSKAFGFLVLADGSYFETLQIVFHDNMDNFDEICKCNVGAAVIVKGTLIPTPEANSHLRSRQSALRWKDHPHRTTLCRRNVTA